MKLVVGVCYPDGDPPDCQERFLYYDNEDAAEQFDHYWSERSPIHLFVESGVVDCLFIDFEFREGTKGEQIEGEYAMVIVQEIEFIPEPPRARFH